MRAARSAIFWCVALLVASVSGAEAWPTLEEFASDCVLVVKARQVGTFGRQDGTTLTFEVIETWKGRFEPADFVQTSREGFILARQGEHGVEVEPGQEIVFFFTRHNQPEGRLKRHNTAFPVRAGTVIYASTNWSLRRELTVEEFKRAIEATDVE